jgi:hypothetical protein
MRIPNWLARIAACAVPVQWMTEARGASNEKAKRELGLATALAELARGLPRGADR